MTDRDCAGRRGRGTDAAGEAIVDAGGTGAAVGSAASATPLLLESRMHSSARAGCGATTMLTAGAPSASAMTAALLPSVPSLIMINTPPVGRSTLPA
ncbi:MAG TPA: hypothetical protein VE989_05015 [Sphingomicrobium sp.]|nr:hypothetical protein [Sphingomicrobium sp.]